ncbi:MAG: putative bifunctional diguanylate cyclase/phosphodiesterase [Acidimicrobiales bacterium]
MPDAGWVAQQLVRYLSELTPSPDRRPTRSSTLQIGAERAAEAVEAEFAAVVWQDKLVVDVGFGPKDKPSALLAPILAGSTGAMEISGLTFHAAAVAVGETGRLVVARSTEPFDQEELQLLRGLGRILGLSLRSVDALVAERSLRRESERRARESLRDPLTGLPNRTLFLDRLETAAAKAQRRSSSIAVLFMDLDGFKLVNDTLGHATGDELLRAVAARLAEATRSGDTVARLGGDEFAVLVDDLADRHQAEAVAAHLLAAFRPAFSVAGRDLHVSTSIGIALGPSPQGSPGLMLRDADLAMYRAKGARAGGYRIFSEDMRQELVERIELEKDLRSGIDDGELTVVYQPVIELADHRLRGLEALVRWRHPTRGLLSPDEFLPTADEAGLMGAIDTWVLEEACRQMAAWRSDFHVSLEMQVGVNLSGDQLSRAGLAQSIQARLDRHRLPATAMILEISETAIFGAGSRADASIKSLADLGMLVALDDFGIGYSSLSRLRELPVRSLKLDRSLVAGVNLDHRLQAVFKGIVNLARDLAIEIVAEGVETPGEDAFIRSTGCAHAQGYRYGRPMPAEALEARFQAAQEGRISIDEAGFLLLAPHDLPMDEAPSAAPAAPAAVGAGAAWDAQLDELKLAL